MQDPYRELGIDPGATEEQVKAAYKQLAQKYAAENYAGNPLADLAEKKMVVINSAYDQIIAEKRLGSRKVDSQANTWGGGNAYGGYSDIRNLLQQGRNEEARQRLLSIPSSGHTAEWHYLMGYLNNAEGRIDEATTYFETAARMDPANAEYRAAFNRVRTSRGGPRQTNNPYGGYRPPNTSPCGCSGCDICTGLVCADCCCECLGGDLIRCC